MHFRAMTLRVGCMITESAVIGRRSTSLGLFTSTMTTWLEPPTCSRTTMNLSDSMVTFVKLMHC